MASSGALWTLLLLLLLACASTLAVPVEFNIAYDELSSYQEADILPDKDRVYTFTHHTHSLSQTTKMAITDNHRLWPGGRLPYKIDFDPLEHVNAYNILMSAINRINAEKCVNLMEAGNQSKDYVSIQLGDYLSSHLGRQGGQQVLTFSDNANWGTIMHEFMHTLGFGHEHNRPDRDEYVEVYFDNIQDAAKPYFKRYGPESGISGDFAPYDYTSLMHATNQHREDINIDITKPVIERLDGQENLGQRDHLTEGDKARMRIVYSCGMCKDPSNESMLFRYPGNCNMYYQCAQGQAVPRQCPQNLHFSESKDRCDYANEANCTFAGLV